MTLPPAGRGFGLNLGPGKKKKYRFSSGPKKGQVDTFREGTPLPLGPGQGLEFGLPFDPATRGGRGIERGKILLSSCTVVESKTCWGESISVPCQILKDPGIYQSQDRSCLRIAVDGLSFHDLLKSVTRAAKHLGDVHWPYQLQKLLDPDDTRVSFEVRFPNKNQNIAYVPNERKRLFQHEVKDVFDTYNSDLNGVATLSMFMVKSAVYPDSVWRLKFDIRAFEVKPDEEQLQWDRGDAETVSIMGSEMSFESDLGSCLDDSRCRDL